MHSLITLTFPALLALAGTAAVAKLPPPSDEAKAKAAEVASKAAHTNKVADYQLCKSMDKVAAQYHATQKQAGKPVSKPTETASCADPGAFTYTPPAAVAPPIEAAGAHSPPKTASTPPNTNAPASTQPAKK